MERLLESLRAEANVTALPASSLRILVAWLALREMELASAAAASDDPHSAAKLLGRLKEAQFIRGMLGSLLEEREVEG